MNLIIELDEATIASVAEKTIKKALAFSDYSAGDMAKYIEDRTRSALADALKEHDFKPTIRFYADEMIRSVVEAVTRKEIEKLVKQTVKSMKEKGELLK